jgi:hypothetical protein
MNHHACPSLVQEGFKRIKSDVSLQEPRLQGYLGLSFVIIAPKVISHLSSSHWALH